jgi:hypothetical protein
MPSISPLTGPYSAQLAERPLPAALAGSWPPSVGDARAPVMLAFCGPSPQLRSICASITYESAASASSAVARMASAQTKPCASTHSRGMKRMQPSVHPFNKNSL